MPEEGTVTPGLLLENTQAIHTLPYPQQAHPLVPKPATCRAPSPGVHPHTGGVYPRPARGTPYETSYRPQAHLHPGFSGIGMFPRLYTPSTWVRVAVTPMSLGLTRHSQR